MLIRDLQTSEAALCGAERRVLTGGGAGTVQTGLPAERGAAERLGSCLIGKNSDRHSAVLGEAPTAGRVDLQEMTRRSPGND